MHENPNNLKYYFLENQTIKSGFEIIKSANYHSVFGAIEIAVIGTSHFFKLENRFFEILTCTEVKDVKANLVCGNSNSINYFSKCYNDFTYRFEIEKIVLSQSEFKHYEKELLSNQSFLSHAFGNKTGVTALELRIENTKVNLQTWHSYPEYNQIVISHSKIIKT